MAELGTKNTVALQQNTSGRSVIQNLGENPPNVLMAVVGTGLMAPEGGLRILGSRTHTAQDYLRRPVYTRRSRSLDFRARLIAAPWSKEIQPSVKFQKIDSTPFFRENHGATELVSLSRNRGKRFP